MPVVPRFQLEPATPADAPAIAALLAESALPAPDLDAARFVVARGGAAILGTAALQRDPSAPGAALLRSVAVRPDERGTGLGVALVAHQLAAARAQADAPSIYLLTTSAARFFERFGFVTVARSDVPEIFLQASGACPATATCMVLSSAQQASTAP